MTTEPFPTEVQEYEDGPLSPPDRGIRIAPSLRGSTERAFLQQEAYRFAKWIRKKQPEILISIDEAPTIHLRSGDYYLPLVFLASDVTLPFYINLAASYVYDMARGALKHDRTTVKLEVIYKDTKSGRNMRLRYDGPVDGLKAIIRKL